MTETNAYKPINKDDITFFQSVVGVNRVEIGKSISHDYAHDEMTPENLRKLPDVMIFVKSTEEVSKIMKYCNTQRIAVTPRGQGTGLVGGCVPIHGGLLLNMSKMNRIIEIDQKNLIMTVEPGAIIMEIRGAANKLGLFYAPMPGEQSASIGGNISTNAGGMTAMKYGVTREWVEGLEVVLANGEIMKLGGAIMKNSSGYSLKDIIIGSEGTLAVVTKAILKLIPAPKKSMSLLIPFPSMQIAIEAAPKIITNSNILPTSLEFMEREVILDAEQYLGKKFPDNSANAYLLITVDGTSTEELEKQYEMIADVCLKIGAIDCLISDTPERQETIWSARSVFLEAIKASTTDMDECDVVVPRKEIANFLLYTQDLRKQYNIRIKSFAHVGDGNLHVYILKDQIAEAEWTAVLDKIMNALYVKAKTLGGCISGEHGIGFIKKANLESHFGKDSPELKMMRAVKKAFDPNNILNPGKIC